MVPAPAAPATSTSSTLQATLRGFEAAVHAEGHEAVPRHLTCRESRDAPRITVGKERTDDDDDDDDDGDDGDDDGDDGDDDDDDDGG